MKKDLVKKLDALVKKKIKISVKSAAKSLKAKENEIIDAAMKLSDEFAVTKSNNKISFIIYNKKPNVKEIVDELTKLIKQIKDVEFKDTKKSLLTCIMFLEKKQYIDDVDKVTKAVISYSKDLQSYVKLFNELNDLEKKSEYYSELVKKYSKKIDEDTKIMNEHAKTLNDLLECMRKCFEQIKKQRESNNTLTQDLYLLIIGEKLKHKSIIDLLGIRKLLPEKKIIKEEDKKKEETKEKNEKDSSKKEGLENEPDKENNYIQKPEDEIQPKSKFMKMSGKFQTEIDELLKLAKEEGKVSFTKLVKLYEEKTEIIEQWCEALEETGIISIHYPLIGSPYIKYEKKDDKP